MPSTRKLLVTFVVFLLFWAGWCYGVIWYLGPKITGEQLYTHAFILSWAVCLIPLVLFGAVLVVWLKSGGKR
jgi:hypothetical protein